MFINRIGRALLLDVGLYREVGADKGATGQALGVVILVGIASGIGMVGVRGVGGIVLETAATLLSWIVWAFVTYLLGTKLFPESRTESDVREMMRAVGFAFSPGLMRVFSFIPYLGGVFVAVSWIWTFAAVVIAARQALKYTSVWRATGIAVIGFVIVMIIFYVLMTYIIILLFAYGFRDA